MPQNRVRANHKDVVLKKILRACLTFYENLITINGSIKWKKFSWHQFDIHTRQICKVFFDEQYLQLFEIDLPEITDSVLALLLARKSIRDCYSELAVTDDQRIKSIIECRNQNIDLLYTDFKEKNMDIFMSKRSNVVLLELYLQSNKEKLI